MIYTGYISILISILIFYYLVDTIIRKVGVQSSISASFYELDKKGKLLFKVSLIFFPIFLLFGFLLLNYEPFMQGRFLETVLIFFSCMGTSFVGVSAAFRDKPITNTFHLAGVWSSVIIGHAYLIYTEQYDLVVISIIGLFISHRYTKKPTFYDEIVVFCTITYGIIRNSFYLF